MPTTTSNLSGVVINEVGTSPTTGQLDLNNSGSTDFDDEFIELYNTSGAPVDISGWQLWYLASNSIVNSAAGNIHTFAPGTTLNAGEYIVVADVAGGTSNGLAITNAVFMNPTVNSATLGTPTFMSLADNAIVVLYDPGANQYVQFSGEDSDAADQAVVDAHFSSATLVGAIETGLEDNTGNSAQRISDGDSTWVDFTQTPGAANMCFAQGTLIAAQRAEITVEDLAIGDMIRTADGRDVPVLWIGRQTISRRRHGAHMQPVRIRAGAFGGGLPHSDLTVTADHGMVIDDLVVNASALVNGETIDFVPMEELPDSFTVYHIETEAHDVILANGAPSETFIDMAGRSAFDNYQEYLDLYGADRIIPEMDRLRIATQRLLPNALRWDIGGVSGQAKFGTLSVA